MSDFRAVATVTAALQRLLQGAVSADVPGADAWTDRPDRHNNGTTDGPGVNIYLYQVGAEPTQRNSDLPTRGPGGQVRLRPQVPLALHYLLSFYGDEGELEPQRVLGSAVRTLHARPLVTHDLIDAVTAAAHATPPVHPSLADADLADQIDLVRVTPLPLNLEELSKLWSVFFQVPYTLSVAYQASIVFLEEPVVAVGGPPVLQPEIVVGLLRRPRVTRVDAVSGTPVSATDILAVHGERLVGETTAVRVGSAVRTPSSMAPDLLTVDLRPVTGLRPGPVPVQVNHGPLGEQSGVTSFLLHPTITVRATQNGGPATVTATTDLPIGADQTAVLALLDPLSGQRLHLFVTPPREDDETEVTVPLPGVGAGRYIVVLSVDGADSPVERDADGHLTGPAVTLT
jgi:hypothetical protein